MKIVKRGHSLIELMVVIAVIVCLSLISMPSLMRFVAKAKRAEAYVMLRSLALAERAFFAEHGYYTKTLFGVGGLGWKPEGNYNYTYGFNDGSEGNTYFTGHLKTPAYALQGSYVSSQGFIICAAGKIHGDKPDILSIDQDNVIRVVQDGLT